MVWKKKSKKMMNNVVAMIEVVEVVEVVGKEEEKKKKKSAREKVQRMSYAGIGYHEANLSIQSKWRPVNSTLRDIDTTNEHSIHSESIVNTYCEIPSNGFFQSSNIFSLTCKVIFDELGKRNTCKSC